MNITGKIALIRRAQGLLRSLPMGENERKERIEALWVLRLSRTLRKQGRMDRWIYPLTPRFLRLVSESLGNVEIAFQSNGDGTIQIFTSREHGKTKIDAYVDRPFVHTHPYAEGRKKNFVPSPSDFEALKQKNRESGRSITDLIFTWDERDQNVVLAYRMENEDEATLWYLLPEGIRLKLRATVDVNTLASIDAWIRSQMMKSRRNHKTRASFYDFRKNVHRFVKPLR